MTPISDIKVIQSLLREMLEYFADVCENNGLTYYLANGTLLGAVKYREFIPWDDDVDILMPREDYDRLMVLCEINNDRYALRCQNMVPSWRMPYSKLTDTRTVLHEGDFEFGADLGVSIDIFPIDRWCSCRYGAYLQAIRSDLRKRMLIASNGETFATKKTGLQKLFLQFIWKRGQAMTPQKLRKKIECQIHRNSRYKMKYVGCLAWTCHAHREVLSASVFDGVSTVSFCGREYPAPALYEQYLDQLYGEWRKELSPKKQISNHRIKVWWKDEE